MKIIAAIPGDSKNLTELTIRSKSYWEYGEEQINAWLDELTITEKYLDENEVYKIIDNKLLIGFYAYATENDMDIKLNFLFIDPKFIGKGYGKLLIVDFFKRIETSTCKRVILDADPNAEKFYSKFGFQVIGKTKSSIKNRFLPNMARKIKPVNQVATDSLT